MKCYVTVKDDKIISKDFQAIWRHLEDGEYEVSIRQLNEQKTLRDYQREYFSLVDIVVSYTGYRKMDLHTMFKQYRIEEGLVASTKNLQTVAEWNSYIENFRFYIYNQLEVMV